MALARQGVRAAAGNWATSSRLRGLLVHPQALITVLLAAYVAAIAVFVPQILSLDTAEDVVVAMLPLAIAVIGQTFVLVVAQIDLSVTSSMAMGSVVAASIMTGSGGYLAGSPLAVPVGLLVFPLVGLVIGLANGASTARLGMPSFIVTLAVMMFTSGASVWYASLHTRSVSIGNLPAAFRTIGYGHVLGVPIALVLAVAVAVAAHLTLTRSLLGRWMYAVGLNPKAARISGVPVGRVVVAAFVISGVCAGLAALIYSSRIETGTPVLAQNLLLDITSR